MADARLSEWTEDQAVPVVAVAAPDTRGKRATIDLPGRLEAYSQAQIFARVSGYIKEWKADIGTPVKAGQLLAEIDAPDLDQQIMQAQADLASAQANATLSKATLERGQSLITSGAVSKQDLDQRTADAGNKQGAGQVVAGQSRSTAGAGEIQTHHRAVRRARDCARDRRRRADQRRIGRRSGVVRGFGHHQIARLRQRPAKLRAERQARHQGAALGPRISRARTLPPSSKRRPSPSMLPRAPRGCSSSSTTPAAN